MSGANGAVLHEVVPTLGSGPAAENDLWSVKAHVSRVAALPVGRDLPQAALDIDRPEDLARLEFQTGATRTREFLHRIDAWARLRHGASESPVTLARHAS